MVADVNGTKRKEWIRRGSDKIAPVGTFSGAYGKAVVDKFSMEEDSSLSKNGLHDPWPNSSPTETAEEIKKQVPTIYQSLKNKEVRFEHKLEVRKLKIKEVAGDGNCLFRAVSDQLYGTEDHHDVLREWCMNYLVVEKEYFSQYIVGGMEAFEDYVTNKRQSSVWGDDLEIEALSEIYGRPIEIYAYDDKPMRTFHETTSAMPGLKAVRLSYHGRSHFNSVIALICSCCYIRSFRQELRKNLY